MSTRFSYVKYDDPSVKLQNEFKALFEQIEVLTNQMANGRAKSLCLTSLEEAYMWVGKAIRDDQRALRSVEEQPERKDG